MIMYRIRNRDGNYSKGGRFPWFTKKGKIWRNLKALHLHLFSMVEKNQYPDCELVVVEVVENEIAHIPINDYINDVITEKAKSEEERKQRAERFYKQEQEFQERKLLAELKQKYEDNNGTR